VILQVPAYAKTIGLSSNQGYILNAILNVGQMVGRPFIGLSSDRIGRINGAVIYTFGCAVCIFAFWIPAEIAPSPYALLLFFSIVGGALAGTFWTTIAPVGAEVVGLADLPAALSLTWVLMVPPTTVAEAIALELRHQNQEQWVYLPPQIFTACMYVGGALCLWVVRGWKIGQLEEVERRLKEDERRSRGSVLNALEKRTGQGEAGAGGEIERVATQDEVRKVGWQGKDLVRRMMKWQKV
jgi:MFS family permease